MKSEVRTLLMVGMGLLLIGGGLKAHDTGEDHFHFSRPGPEEEALLDIVDVLDDTNVAGPNAVDGTVDWSQLVNVPAGFADGVDAGAGGSGLSDFVDVTTVGVTGNGSTDDSAAITTALSNYDKLYFPQGTYKINSGFSIPSDKILVANQATWTADSLQTIDIQGTTDNTSAFNAAAEKGQFQIQADDEDEFTTGDWIVIQDSTEAYNNSSKGTFQQLVEILDVDTTNPGYDILTLAQPTAGDYTLGTSAKATITETVPVENVWADLGTMGDNVKLDIRRARASYIKAKATVEVWNHADGFDAQACDRMTLEIETEHPIGTDTGMTETITLDGFNHSTITVQSIGGSESTLRIRNGANLQVDANIVGAGIRSVWMYRISGWVRPITAYGQRNFDGNAEHILVDYCHDLVLESPTVYGWEDGDGLELRGSNTNIDIRNPQIFAAGVGAGYGTQNGINFHGGNVNVRIWGGHIIGGDTQAALHFREKVHDTLVQGLRIEPFLGDTSFAPVFIGEDMNGTAGQVNLTLRDMHIVTATNYAIVARNEDGGSGVLENILLENIVFDYVNTAPSADIVAFWETSNSTLKGLQWIGGGTKDVDIGYLANTSLYVEQDSCSGVTFTKGATTFRASGPLN